MMQNRLKELRKNYDYTLNNIQNITGIKRGTYNNYENGKTEPKLETWQKLADIFHVSVPYLKGYTVYICDNCGKYFIPDPNARSIDIKCCPYCFGSYWLRKITYKNRGIKDKRY